MVSGGRPEKVLRQRLFVGHREGEKCRHSPRTAITPRAKDRPTKLFKLRRT